MARAALAAAAATARKDSRALWDAIDTGRTVPFKHKVHARGLHTTTLSAPRPAPPPPNLPPAQSPLPSLDRVVHWTPDHSCCRCVPVAEDRAPPTVSRRAGPRDSPGCPGPAGVGGLHPHRGTRAPWRAGADDPRAQQAV